MRNFSGASGGAASSIAIRPFWLVALHFTSGTVRYSSRGNYTYGGNLYTAAGLTVTSDQIKIFDEQSTLSPPFLIQRTPIPVDIYEAFGAGPVAEGDFDHVFCGEIGGRNLDTHITCQLRSITLRPEPHIYVQAPTFNHLPAREAIIHTPTGTYTLPAAPTATPAPTPPSQYRSPTIPAWVHPVAPAASLNTQPTLEELQGMVSAEGSVIPIHFGPFQWGGSPFAVAHASGTWTMGMVVGLGQIEAIDQVWINGAAPVSGVVVNSYLGTTSQTADPLLAAAISGYADALIHDDDGTDVGIAYIVIQYTNSHYPALPSVIIEGRGLKVFDPQTNTTGYSDSPALALRHFCHVVMGEPVDATSCLGVKTANADLVGGEARRKVGITLDRAQPPEQWIEVLRTYAGAYCWKRGPTWHFQADRPGSVTKVFTGADVVRGTLRIAVPDQTQAPTVVKCTWTDTTDTIWKAREAPSIAPGVATGEAPRINSTIRLTGVQRESQATREAIERRKKLAKALRIEFEAFADHADLEFGDIIEMNGFSRLPGNPKYRIVAPPRRTERGNVQLIGVEYDPTCYDDSVPSPTTGGGIKIIGETTLPASGTDGLSVGISLSASTLFSQAPNGGAWSHTTADATFTWRRGATVVATRVIRATLDTGTLLITLSSISSSGEATSFSAPSPAAQITATVSHTSTGTPNSIGFDRVQGGSQGSPGTSSTAPTANFGGQWGALGDLVIRPNLNMGSADDGELTIEGAAGGNWLVYHGATLTPRAGARVAVLTPWEGDQSAELGARDNTFFVLSMASTGLSRWGSPFENHIFVTATFEPTTRTWKAYPNSVGSAVTFTPLTTDVVIGVGFKVSTTGGIDRLTTLMTAVKITPATAGLIIDFLSLTGALMADATIGSAKITDLAANKLTAGTISAVLALANQLQIAAGGKIWMGKSTYGAAQAGFYLGDDSGLAKFVVGNADGSKQISWDGNNFTINGELIQWGVNIGGVGVPDNYATRNADSYFEDFSHGSIAQFDAEWTIFAANGERDVINHSWSPVGGKALRVGNNSGFDDVNAHRKISRATPTRLNQVYMCRMVIAKSGGTSNQLYVGVAGVDRYRAALVNSAGANSVSNQFYWGRNGGVPPDDAFYEYVFWFKRTGGAVSNVYAGAGNSPKNPAIIHADAHFVVPIFYTNYSNQSGIYDIGLIELRPYDPPEWNSNIVGQPSDSAILNTSALIFHHEFGRTWVSFGTTIAAYKPSSTTQDLPVQVRDATGTVIASRTITGTVTASNGNINVPSDTVSGIQVTTSGNNTPFVTLTITYSGKTSTAFFTTTPTTVGGVGK